MGNAALSIVLDNDTHVAGTTLTGRIVMQVHRKIAGQEIVLLVKGKEKTCIKRGKQTRYARRDFFNARITIRDFVQRSKVKPGSYSFPFSIELPESLPSTFSYGRHPNACFIQYKCAASVGGATAHRYFSMSSSPMQDIRVPCFLEPKTQEISSMGFKSTGSITFGVGVDDTHVGKGQDLIFSVACRNDTVVDIEHVDVKVVELVTYRVDAGWSARRKNVLVHITELDLPGLVTRRKSKEEVRLDKLAGPDALRQSNFPQIYEELSSGRNSIRIRIPQSASDSYYGTLVTISHYVKLYLKTPKLVMDIEEKIPLRVGVPPRVQQATRVDIRPQPSAQAPPGVTSIPFVAAVPLPSNTVEAPVATAPAEAIVLGGTATTYVSNDTMEASSTDFGEVIPLPPPQVPSLAGLLEEMTASVNDIDIISSKLNNADWRPIFSEMSPADYGSVIAHVNMDFDQPRVAAMLALYVNEGCFTCDYCLSAIQNAAQWNRTAMVQKLLPLCVDVRTGFAMLQQELSPWEQTVAARDFQQVLDHSDR